MKQLGQEVDKAELEARRAQLQARKVQDALDPQSAAADPATVSCEGRKGGAKRGAKREEDQTLSDSIENNNTRGADSRLPLSHKTFRSEVQPCTSSSEPLINTTSTSN